VSKPDFRPFVFPLDEPKIAGLQGHTPLTHTKRNFTIPRVQMMFSPWEGLYQQPYRGITSDGVIIPNLFKLQPNGAPTNAMVIAAQRLLAVLPEALRAKVGYPVDAHEWRRWQNTEMYMHETGLRLEDLSGDQREAVLALLRASLGAKGYDKTRDVMRMNLFLGELVHAPHILGEWSYNFSLYGTPARNEPWGWQLFGHHLALNCFVIGDQMTISPTFFGAEPDYADTGPFPRERLFEDEENGGLELMRSLSAAQQAKALIYTSMSGGDMPPERFHMADQRHLGGAFQDNRIIPYEGITGLELTPAQRQRLLDLVQAYLIPLPEGPKKARMEDVERHLTETRFSWIGDFQEDSVFYYRIQSPVLLIEFDHHSGVFLSNEEPAKFHVHTIVRTPNGNDYGLDLLRLHYEQAHKGHRPGHS
jgi:hypothetical protein